MIAKLQGNCRHRLPLLWLLLLVTGLVAWQPAYAEPAGTIELVNGIVTIYGADGSSRTPATGDPVHEGDRIVTSGDGELQLRMEDSGYLAVRADTEMVVAQYRANGDEQDNVLLELISGTFRSITGWVGKYNRDSYRVSTPTATIGIRGTDHEPLVVTGAMAAQRPELEAGTYDKVNEGGTTLRNALGQVEVNPGQTGLAAARRSPVRLRHLPELYRPTVNEGLIERIKPELMRDLDERRGRKQKLIERLRRQQEENNPGGNGSPDVPDALREKVKSGEISRQKAKQIMKRYHNR